MILISVVLKEASRQGSQLESFNEDIMREIYASSAMVKGDDALKGDLAEVTIKSMYKEKLKRAALIYIETRCNTIRNIIGQVGGIPENEAVKLSEEETEYASQYTALRTQYFSSVGFPGEFCRRPPPKKLMVQVRIVKDCGKIQTPNGFIDLSSGSIHLLERTFVENLIRNGHAEHID